MPAVKEYLTANANNGKEKALSEITSQTLAEQEKLRQEFDGTIAKIMAKHLD